MRRGAPRWRNGLALRFGAASAALAALLVTLGAWGVSALMARESRREAERLVRLHLSLVDLEVERAAGELGVALDRLLVGLERDEPSWRERWGGGGPRLAGEAARLAARADLDVLTLLDGEEVLSSAHWPQLAGLEEPSLAGLEQATRGALRRVAGAEGSRVAVVAVRRIDSAGRDLRIVAGRTIDRRFAERFGPAVVTMIVDLDPEGMEPITTRSDLPGDPALWLRWARGEGAAPAAPAASGDRRWIAERRILLDDRGQPLAVVGFAASSGVSLPARATPLWVGLGLLVVLVAAAGGAWVGSSVSYPVDRLVRAVDAIAAGEADYAVSATPAVHELDRLAAAFSRLQRSLERQQRLSAAAERVAAWKEIARRVAHEVKNPLVPIRLTVENLQRARSKGPSTFDGLFDEGARTILEEVDQLRRLVDEFSEFARLPAPRPRRLELEGLIEGVLELYGAEPGLEIRREYAARGVQVDVDADQLSRALKNVVGNAIEAMRDGAAPPRLDIRTSVDNGMVRIEVADRGPGIPAEVADRMFDPYVTTKPGGTGLGMAISYRIVTEHGGEIEAENRLDGGACVRVRLPVAAGG